MAEINNYELPEEVDEADIIRELDDGSVIVPDPDFVEEEIPPAHDDNLADRLPSQKLVSIASELCDLIEKDREARKERDKLYEEGLKRTGLADEAPGGADFPGASRAVHPVLAEACVDYGSAAIREVFPPEGPVKMHFLSAGNTPDSIEKAENKRDYLNWKLTKQIVEYKTELEVLFTQQPLGGSQYLKFWYDTNRRRIRCEYVPIDRVILPYAASSFLTSDRFTITDAITTYELERRVKSGLYIDLNLHPSSIFPDLTASEEANEKIEGKEQDSENVDGLREIYEVYAYYDVEDTGPAPYIITIDKDEEKILSIYRNWEETDTLKECLNYVVEFPFIPWRGAQGIGLTHLIGSLAGAATGALRALLDSALINNFPGAVKLKGGKASGETVNIGPTQIVELEAPATSDDIRKIIMPMPFNPPSTVLFQLLGFVVEAAKGVVSTAEEKISDATNQMPVGTAMALIEQGSKVFSAIHARQHAAQQRCLEIIQRLDAKYYDEEIQIKTFGKVLVTVEDLANTGNVIPVSDPNIFSESQRFAQVQGVLQMAQDQTVQWNKYAIYNRMLRLMHVEAPQELLTPPPQPISADPVTEIIAAMSGKQIQPQPEMDHKMHMIEELTYLLDPIFGAANQTLMNPGFQTVMQDVNQHLILLYQQFKNEASQMAMQELQVGVFQQLIQIGLAPEQIQQIIQQQMSNPQVQQQLQQQAFQIFNMKKQEIQDIIEMQQQAAELVKTKVPPPQLDPQSQAAIQIAQMQEQTKSQIAQIKDQNEKSKMQMDTALENQKLELEKLIELKIKPQAEIIRQQAELAKNDSDNAQKSQTELMKNSDDNETEMIKNREDNKTNILINQMREEAALERATLLEQMRLQFEENKSANENTNKLVETILKQILAKNDGESGPSDVTISI